MEGKRERGIRERNGKCHLNSGSWMIPLEHPHTPPRRQTRLLGCSTQKMFHYAVHRDFNLKEYSRKLVCQGKRRTKCKGEEGGRSPSFSSEKSLQICEQFLLSIPDSCTGTLETQGEKNSGEGRE